MEEPKELREAFESANQLTWSEGREEAIIRSHEQGVQKGIENGKLEEKRNTARNLKSMGLDKEIISKATSLSP